MEKVNGADLTVDDLKQLYFGYCPEGYEGKYIVMIETWLGEIVQTDENRENVIIYPKNPSAFNSYPSCFGMDLSDTTVYDILYEMDEIFDYEDLTVAKEYTFYMDDWEDC
jgi:hypothetical protein